MVVREVGRRKMLLSSCLVLGRAKSRACKNALSIPIGANLRRPLQVGTRRPQGSRRGKTVFYTFFHTERADILRPVVYSRRHCVYKFVPMVLLPKTRT